MKKIFCERLREARGVRPQGKCAELLGISQVSLSQWERGTREPNLDALERIAKIFCVSVDWLLGLSDARAPRPAPLSGDALSADAEALRAEVARLREAVAARDAANPDAVLRLPPRPLRDALRAVFGPLRVTSAKTVEPDNASVYAALCGTEAGESDLVRLFASVLNPDGLVAAARLLRA